MRNAKLCQESDCIWPSTPEYAKVAHSKIEMALWSRQVECHQQSPGHWWPPASGRLLRYKHNRLFFVLSVHVYCVNLDVFFMSSGLFQITIQQHSEVPAPREKKDEKHLSSVIMWPCRVPNLDFVCAATWRTLLSHSWSALRWYSSSKLLTLCHKYSYKHIFIVFHYIKLHY